MSNYVTYILKGFCIGFVFLTLLSTCTASHASQEQMQEASQ